MDIEAHLAAAGFDLVHPFDPMACARAPGLGMLADPAHRRGLLVGNTRALWPKFLAAADLTRPDPLERYVEDTFAAITNARCLFAHRRYDGAFVPFQRLAVAAGLGTLAATQLVIHPVYGPWFALRAVLLLEGEPVTRALPPPSCDCTAGCLAAFERAQSSRDWRAWLAVRDACTVGREHRYSDEQIAYHYTKNRSLLG